MQSPLPSWISRSFAVFAVGIVGVATGAAHFKLADSLTGNSMTVIVQTTIHPTINGQPFSIGDEIAVFGSSDSCFGRSIWTDSNLSIAVWGYDEVGHRPGMNAGDKLHFRVWDPVLGEGPATVTYNKSNPIFADSTFVPNVGISLLASLTAHGSAVLSSAPVPKKDGDITFRNGGISYTLYQASRVELVINDLRGRAALAITQRQAAGSHAVDLRSWRLAPGSYLVRFTSNGLTRSIPLVISE